MDNILKIKLRIDTDLFGFQDFNNYKTITLLNSETKAKIKVSYISLDPDLYFYIDTIMTKKVLAIVDKFAGKNSYDYSTLELINTENCFKKFGGCGGFNDSSFATLGTPYLAYDNKGFHR